MANNNETLFYLPAGSSITLSVSADPTHSIGFSGWRVLADAEPDPFETFVREARRDAGIVDPDPPRTFGQIIWSGHISIPSPPLHGAIHDGAIHGITSGYADSSDETVYEDLYNTGRT